jgi:hypothetical protein
MTMVNRLLVTRHAPYDIDCQTGQEFLTDEGLRVCQEKVTDLQTHRDIGRDAILLSSASKRAKFTTAELRRGLGTAASYRSRFIEAVGVRPEPVKNLYDFTAMVLEGCGIEHEGRDVVAVTHQPLLYAKDRDLDEGIAEVPQDWLNPRHRPDQAWMANGEERSLDIWLRPPMPTRPVPGLP